MKTCFKRIGAVCASVLVFALAMLVGAGIPASGWLLWYLFALSLGSVGGMIALVSEN